mgnify:CR=1 FL=1|jgi:hypothetical protein
MRLDLLLALLFALVLTPGVRAQESSPEDDGIDASAQPEQASAPIRPRPASDAGRELFVRAAAAIRDAKSITYSVRSYASGSFLSTTSRTIRADARQARAPGGLLPGWRLRMTGEISAPGGKEPFTQFDVAWLIAGVEWVDHESRSVIEKTGVEARRARGPNSINAARLDDLTAPQPFSRELSGTEFALQPPAEADGVRCNVVLVTFNQGRNTALWYFGADDHLPRRVERIITAQGQESGRVIMEWTNVRADTADPSQSLLASLRVDVPDGYAEDRPPVPVPVPGANSIGGPSFEPPPADKGEHAKGAPSKSDTPAWTPDEESGVDRTPPMNDLDPAPQVPAPPAVAPDFTLQDASGNSVSLASLRGNIVILEFAGSWAVSLPQAHDELAPLLERIQGLNVRAFTLAVRERSRDMAIEGHRPPSPALGLLLNADPVAKAYSVRVFPSYALVDAQGILVMPPRPYVPESTIRDLSDALDAALAAGKP